MNLLRYALVEQKFAASSCELNRKVLLLRATARLVNHWLNIIALVVLTFCGASSPLRAATAPLKLSKEKQSRATPVAEDLPAVFRKTNAATLDDFKAIEQHIKTLLPKISPSVVAVQVGGATGSAVVISEDGLVLSAAHVCEEPNRNVRFIFPDGRTARGKTLGTNHEADAGMMKITDRGPWPHVEMGDLNRARLGDWVLTLGHPGGYDPERPIVVRLGRVIRIADDAVQTDCTITAGDSGGPLFDMRGGVIGIHSWIADSAAENFHVPITPFREGWERLTKSESWGGEQPAERPWIGARGVDHPAGCQLETITENGPAFKAGVKTGDIVRLINNREVRGYASMKRLIADAKPGDDLKLSLRRGEEDLAVTVKVETRPRR